MLAKISLMLAAFMGIWSAAPATGQQKDLPPVVVAGLQAYQRRGAAAALTAWLAESPARSDSTLASSTLAALNTIQGAYGSFLSFDVVGSSPIGSRVLRSYVILLYETGPLYAYFDTYRASGKWIVTAFLFNTKPEAIMPHRLLDG